MGLAVKLENQPLSALKEYDPVVVDLCAQVVLRTSMALDFFQRWPTFGSLDKSSARNAVQFVLRP